VKFYKKIKKKAPDFSQGDEFVFLKSALTFLVFCSIIFTNETNSIIKIKGKKYGKLCNDL
jgi:hypothetical protein